MRALSSFATPKEGVAWQLNQNLTPPEKLRVKVREHVQGRVHERPLVNERSNLFFSNLVSIWLRFTP